MSKDKLNVSVDVSKKIHLEFEQKRRIELDVDRIIITLNADDARELIAKLERALAAGE